MDFFQKNLDSNVRFAQLLKIIFEIQAKSWRSLLSQNDKAFIACFWLLVLIHSDCKKLQKFENLRKSKEIFLFKLRVKNRLFYCEKMFLLINTKK